MIAFKQYDWVKIVTNLGFLCLGILSIIYAQERLFTDTGYYFFHSINNQNFHVEHHRYILVLSELPVVIGGIIGLPLKLLVLIYSIWHVFYFYLIYIFIKQRFGEKNVGIELLTILTIGATSGFFVPAFELYVSIGLLMIVKSALKEKCSLWKSPAVLISLFFLYSAHMYAIILLGLVTFIFLISEFKNYLKNSIFLLTTSVLALMIKSITASDYDKGKTNAFLRAPFENNYDIEYWQNFLSHMCSKYLIVVLLFITFLSLLLYYKQYRWLFFGITSTAIMTLLVNFSRYGFGNSRYQEQVYFALTSWIVIMIFLILPKFISSKLFSRWIVPLLSISLILCLFRIVEKGNQKANRLNEMEIICRQNNVFGDKLIVKNTDLNYKSNWSYPLESLIISKIRLGKSVSVITDEDYYFNSNNDTVNTMQYIQRKWEIAKISELNPNYFELKSDNYRFYKK